MHFYVFVLDLMELVGPDVKCFGAEYNVTLLQDCFFYGLKSVCKALNVLKRCLLEKELVVELSSCNIRKQLAKPEPALLEIDPGLELALVSSPLEFLWLFFKHLTCQEMLPALSVVGLDTSLHL